ncbi:MAG: J domain-containing protein [Bdellovibrionales bacterium]
MEIQVAFKILEIQIQESLDETLHVAAEAFKRKALLYHPDRNRHLPPDEQTRCNEQFIRCSEALKCIRTTFGHLGPPRKDEPRVQPVTNAKRPLCVVNLRLTAEEMAPCNEERVFELAYEDACFKCGRTGLCLKGSGDGQGDCSTRVWSAFDILCKACHGERKIRKNVTVRVPRWLVLEDGQQIMQFRIEEPTFYSGGVVRVRPTQQKSSQPPPPPP